MSKQLVFKISSCFVNRIKLNDVYIPLTQNIKCIGLNEKHDNECIHIKFMNNEILEIKKSLPEQTYYLFSKIQKELENRTDIVSLD